LPLRNTAALNHLLSQLYNPSSANYHHFLSVEEFAAQFGPTAEDYQTVVNFAKANGFTVSDTPANRLIVPLSGTVAQINISGVATFEVFRAADMPVVPICFGNGSPLRPEWSIGWRNGDVILFGERTLPPV